MALKRTVQSHRVPEISISNGTSLPPMRNSHNTEQERLIHQCMQRIKERLRSPHVKRRVVYVDMDFAADLFHLQYSAPATREAVQHFCIERTGNGYDLSVVDVKGHIIYTRHFCKTNVHQLCEAWKYLTDAHYRAHRNAIRDAFRKGEHACMETLSHHAPHKASANNHSYLESAIPVLTEVKKLKG